MGVFNVRQLDGTWSQIPATGADHGLLTGLADDDHPQYLFTDGSRVLTGDQTVDTNVKILWRDSTIHIFSNAAGELTIVAPTLTTIGADGDTTFGGTGSARAIKPEQDVNTHIGTDNKNFGQCFLGHPPTGTGHTQGTLMVNPASGTGNLIGAFLNDVAKFEVNESGDVKLAGELLGSRQPFGYGDSTLRSANRFQRTINGVVMTTGKGYRMHRPGSIVGNSVLAVISNIDTPIGDKFTFTARINGDDATPANVVLDDASTGFRDASVTVARNTSLCTFLAGDILTIEAVLTGTLSVDDVIGFVEVQFDT